MSTRSVPVLDYRQLRHRRIAAGMSQADLAGASGCTSAYVSLMERGRRQSPSAHQLARLAGALGCSITDLMVPSPNGLSTGPAHSHDGMMHPGWKGHDGYPIHRHDTTGLTHWETP